MGTMEPGYAEAFIAEGSCVLPGWTSGLVYLQKGSDKQKG